VLLEKRQHSFRNLGGELCMGVVAAALDHRDLGVARQRSRDRVGFCPGVRENGVFGSHDNQCGAPDLCEGSLSVMGVGKAHSGCGGHPARLAQRSLERFTYEPKSAGFTFG
jgi:hypothetical protein